jgi:hypothetical protein
VVAYEFYWLDLKGDHEIIGVLPERRNKPERITQESILNWGRRFLVRILILKIFSSFR